MVDSFAFSFLRCNTYHCCDISSFCSCSTASFSFLVLSLCPPFSCHCSPASVLFLSSHWSMIYLWSSLFYLLLLFLNHIKEHCILLDDLLNMFILFFPVSCHHCLHCFELWLPLLCHKLIDAFLCTILCFNVFFSCNVCIFKKLLALFQCFPVVICFLPFCHGVLQESVWLLHLVNCMDNDVMSDVFTLHFYSGFHAFLISLSTWTILRTAPSWWKPLSWFALCLYLWLCLFLCREVRSF